MFALYFYKNIKNIKKQEILKTGISPPLVYRLSLFHI